MVDVCWRIWSSEKVAVLMAVRRCGDIIVSGV